MKEDYFKNSNRLTIHKILTFQSVNGFAEDIKEKITNIFKEILEIINKAAEEVKQQTKNVLSAAFQAIQKFREIALDLVQQVTDKIEDTIEMVSHLDNKIYGIFCMYQNDYN